MAFKSGRVMNFLRFFLSRFQACSGELIVHSDRSRPIKLSDLRAKELYTTITW